MNDLVQCPRCNVTMREREKGDVVIDICPQCRGVWLDAGELERLSERESRYYDDDDDDDWERRNWSDRDPRRDGPRVQEYRGGQPGSDQRSGQHGGGQHGGDQRSGQHGGDQRSGQHGGDQRSGQQQGYYQQKPQKKKSFLSGLMENFGGEGGMDD